MERILKGNQMSLDNLHPAAVQLTNAATAGTIVSSLFGWIPAAITVIAGLFAIIWYYIQIRESITYKEFKAWITQKLE